MKNSAVKVVTVLAIAVCIFFSLRPGITNPDTIDMMWQGLSGKFNTWHSPAASLYLGATFVLGFPDNALAGQSLLASAALVQLVSFLMRSKGSWIDSVILVAGAMYLGTLLVLCANYAVDDMWIALLLTNAVLLLAREKPSTWAIGVAMLLAMMAVLVRPTTLVVVTPIVVSAACLLPARSAGLHWASAPILLAVIGFSPVAVKLVTGAVMTFPDTPTLVFDIIGIEMQHPDRVAAINGKLETTLTEAALEKCWTAHDANAFIWGECAGAFTVSDTNYHDWSYHNRLFREWIGTIVQDPLGYMRHRVAFARELTAPIDINRGTWMERPMFGAIGTNSKQWFPPLERWFGQSFPISLHNEPSFLQTMLTHVQRSVRAFGLNAPGAWHLATLLVILTLLRLRAKIPSPMFAATMAAALSSLFNTLSFIVFAGVAEPRFLCWTLVGSTLSVVLAFSAATRRI